MNKTVLILHQKLARDAKEDELDVLEQVNLVSSELSCMGYRVEILGVDLNLKSLVSRIRNMKPDILFNLVETIDNKGEFAFVATSVFNYLKIPYTGSPLIPMFYASNKILTKKEFTRIGLPTPPWFSLTESSRLKKERQYIIKPIWEEGSLELDEQNVFWGGRKDLLQKLNLLSPDYYFIEEYIEGREFNVSILGGKGGPQVLPLAEMTFKGYPEGKPRIMGYTAKWKEDSFEYTHTCRTFRNNKKDHVLFRAIESACIKCWKAMSLKGYVRIDFRVSNDNTPYIIDINANPCLSSSGGFMAASKKAGLKFSEVLKRILEDAYN